MMTREPDHKRPGRLTSTRIWLFSLFIAVPFAIVQILRIIAAFDESPTRGWQAVAAAAWGVVAVGGILIALLLAFGLPRVLRYRQLKRNLDTELLVCRRALSLPEALHLQFDRDILAGRSDEFFIASILPDRLDLYRMFGDIEPIVSLPAESIIDVIASSSDFFHGTRPAIAMVVDATVKPIAFQPYETRALASFPMRGEQLQSTADALRKWAHRM